MDRVREAFSRREAEEEEEDEPLLSFPPGGGSTSGSWAWLHGRSSDNSWSWSNRIKGFAACFMLGILFNFAGAALLWSSTAVDGFAIAYSGGNILCLLSTCFLCGPRAQFEKMFHRSRILSTFLIFIFLIFTLVAALIFKSNALALCCVFGQSLALTWYSLSYIPIVRDACKKCFHFLRSKCSEGGRGGGGGEDGDGSWLVVSVG